MPHRMGFRDPQGISVSEILPSTDQLLLRRSKLVKSEFFDENLIRDDLRGETEAMTDKSGRVHSPIFGY